MACLVHTTNKKQPWDTFLFRKPKKEIFMENITFTTEQKEQIKQNALAIERYIVENVVPRLAGDVRLEFGGTHQCPRTGAVTPMYVLVIKKEPYYFCAGWNKTQEAHVGLVYGFGPAMILEERQTDALYALLQNWSSLKVKLERAIRDQDAANAFINNFTV